MFSYAGKLLIDFFGKSENLFSKVSTKKYKNSLNFSIFTHKISNPNSILKGLGKKVGQFFINKKKSAIQLTANLTPLTVLPFRNFNFAKINASQINQNALTAKIGTCTKKPKFSKYIRKETNY